jgi:hypothetical protein
MGSSEQRGPAPALASPPGARVAPVAAPLVLSPPPAGLCHALRELALAAFALEERLLESTPTTGTELDARLIAFDQARVRVRDLFRAWAPVS